MELHRNARCGSGGVGFFISDELSKFYNISILDKSVEGILWIKLQSLSSNEVLLACVCYLPPQGSSRYVNVYEFYDALITQVYQYQNMGSYFICGDFNSRCGSSLDYVEGVDDVPSRDIVDHTLNAFGEELIDFMIKSNCCMLNGRNNKNNAYTCFRPAGQSVVDYCIVPHDQLTMHTDFNVITPNDLYTDSGCMEIAEPRFMSDHSLIMWNLELVQGINFAYHKNGAQDDITFTKYDCQKIPESFLNNEQSLVNLNAILDSWQNSENSQENLDNMYETYCHNIKSEMDAKLEKKEFRIRTGLRNKRRRVKKPWWSDVLTERWNIYCEAEDKWRKEPPGNHKAVLKAKMTQCRKDFDHLVQKSKRQYWRDMQQHMMDLHENDTREYWKYFGTLGVNTEQKRGLPSEVIKDDGTVTSDMLEVKSEWGNYFNKLLNPEPGEVLGLDTIREMEWKGQVANQDRRINNEILMVEVEAAIKSAKSGKAVGIDEIPVETLRNSQSKRFLLELFNACFSTGKIPSTWYKGIINPIPKCSTKDPRDPFSYRGITLACSTYKLYCSVLNTRLSKWSEENGLVEDEQNGFRKNRSTLEHLSSLTSIIETRKAAKLSTFVGFVNFSKASDRVPRELLWLKLEKMGLDGNMLQALKGIYQQVQCCVRVQGSLTKFFNVGTGLKQGCLLSPMLFNLYLNDFICNVKESGLGISVDGEKIAILVYADDIVLIAENEQDLQTMMNMLNDWCKIWQMSVNIDKTNVIHFRPKSIPLTDKIFMCDGKEVKRVSQYKYLGLILSEHLDYNITAKMVANAAGRALGLLIAKSRAHGGMPYNCFSKLYSCLVQSIIDYGAAIWGTRDFSCIQAIQNRACRYYLGVGKFTPSAAVQGDMGWRVVSHSQWLAVTRLWCRLINMERGRVNSKIFRWAFYRSNNRARTWCFHAKSFYMNIGIGELCNIDRTVKVSDILQKLDGLLDNYYQGKWKEEVNRVDAKRGSGKNKLRTYRLFKKDFKVENYASTTMPRSHRSALAKFRSGVAPIRLETGRYEGLAEDQRVCPFCKDAAVENELHVILYCPIYADLHMFLFKEFSLLDDNFINMTDTEKLCFILGDNRTVKISAKILNNILHRRRLLIYHF